MDNKKILVLGTHGQLAQAFRQILNDRVQFIDHQTANFLQTETVIDVLNKHQPDILINTAAYTAVDKAESEVREAELVNFITPAAIAQWVAKNNKLMVHYSTDYVFDGFGEDPRTEEDSPQPLGVYGRTKLFGDQAILQTNARALILRTSWVFSHLGHNFVKTMLRVGAEREELAVVKDQIGSPTYSVDLAEMTLKMLESPQLDFNLRNGGQLYNVTGSGYCSWYQFAIEIFRQAPDFLQSPLKVKAIKPILSSEFTTLARRPLNSRLSPTKLERDFQLQMPPWKNSLTKALRAMSTDSMSSGAVSTESSDQTLPQ